MGKLMIVLIKWLNEIQVDLDVAQTIPGRLLDFLDGRLGQEDNFVVARRTLPAQAASSVVLGS